MEVTNQMDHKAFMDVLIHFFIGAEIEDSAGIENCTLFILSALPINDTSQPVTTEQSCHFVITFSKKPFVPCGVYAGTTARLCHVRSFTTVDNLHITHVHVTFACIIWCWSRRQSGCVQLLLAHPSGAQLLCRTSGAGVS